MLGNHDLSLNNAIFNNQKHVNKQTAIANPGDINTQKTHQSINYSFLHCF